MFGNIKSHTTIYKTIQLHDGDYLALGFRQDAGIIGGWAGRLTRDGKKKWEHSYQRYIKDTSSYKVFVDAAERSDGSLVLIGSSFVNSDMPSYRRQDTWLLSIDSNGCEVSGCSTTEVPHLLRTPEKLLVYPNPTTNGKLVIQSPQAGRIIFYTLSGTVVADYMIKQGANDIQLPERLNAGIYAGRFIDHAGDRAEVVRVIYRP